MAETTVNGLRFELFKRTNTARVKNIAQGFKNQSTFDIPETVTSEGIKFRVTEIGDWAFQSGENIASITIPNSVTNIGWDAFYDCKSLASITIPNSVTSIGNNAFYGCSSLTAIMVDANNMVYDSRENSHAIIETATNCLIRGCQNTVIPDSVTTIGDWAFGACKSLTSITIPDSVTSIRDYAFASCDALTSITIPNSVTSIGSRAFSGCKALTSITIPNSVTSIGNDAFRFCKSLTSITIPNSVTSIGESAFDSCDKLTSVTIENEKEKVKISGCAFPYSAKINYVGKPKEQPAKPIENPYHQAIREAEEAAAKAAEKTTVNVETTPEPSQPVSPTTTQTRNRDKANYVFNGKVYTKKVQLVQDLVLHHLSLHPDLTHEQLKKDFQVQKNMDVMFMSYEMYLSTLAEKGIVYFFESKTEEDTIALQDAKILISSNWPTMVGGKPSVFAKLLDKAKELGYEITVQE